MSRNCRRFKSSSPALLSGLVGAVIVGLVLAAAANGCVQSNCTADCMSSLDLDFDSPIGQPGIYQFTIGSHSCSVVLPAASAACVSIRDFAVVGLHSNETPTRSLHVTISKDGVEVINNDATPVSYGTHDVCGSTCTEARFSMPVPSDLVRPFWGPCDQAKLAGTYQVNGSQSGSCTANLFSGPTITLANGLLQMNDSTCTSQLTAWSPNTCKIQSNAICASTLLDVTLGLTLTDVMGDGSRLLGYGDVNMSAPVTCQGSSSLDLVRQ
jgi:hypothetical protein